MGILGTPLGWIMEFLYKIFQNYGVALILFTVIVRLALFPLNVKQQKSSAKMAIFNPKLQKLQKQYGKNKEKYQEEMMKLYEEEGYNPMSSCLPMVAQMVVLFGIIDVVYKPLQRILGVSKEMVAAATKLLMDSGAKASSNAELIIVNIIQGNNKDFAAGTFNTIFSPDVIDKIKDFQMNFMGINMGDIPTWTFPILLIPLLSGVTSLLVSIFSMRQQKKNGMMDQQQAGMGMMKGMMYIMPVFSTYIAFTLPVGVGFYWIVSNVLSFVQTIVLYTIYSPEKMKAKVEEEMKTRKKKKPSKYQAAVKAAQEQQRIAKGGAPAPKKEIPAKVTTPDGEVIEVEEDAEEEISASQRIALARKRMAEKYGDEYEDK